MVWYGMHVIEIMAAPTTEQKGLLVSMRSLHEDKKEIEKKNQFMLLKFAISLRSLIFQTIKSKDAWNSPENSKDFPCCFFEISHVDKTKQSFFCGITTSHDEDTASAEIVSYFEPE